MKLISSRHASSWDLEHAFSVEEALNLMQHPMAGGQEIAGLQQLRTTLMINFDSQVLQQIESGEWLLIKPEANCFNWGQFEGAAREQRVMDAMQHPVPQPKPEVQVLQVLASETLEPLVNRRYTAVIDGTSELRKIDALGFTHLPASAKGAQVLITLK